ncbi:DUF2142 domain-containing protein [Deinococcus sp. UYEF24]
MLVVGLVLTALIPPFQSPDEFDHLERAALLARGVIVLQTPAGRNSGGYIDSGLAEYLGSYEGVARKAETVTLKLKETAEEIGWTGTQVFRETPGTGYYFPAIYLPQAAGLTAGQLLGMTVDASYRLARLLTILTVITILAYSTRFTRPGPLVIAILILPMTLFQMASASIDGTSFALTVFILSVTVRSVQTRQLSVRLLILWSLALFTLLSTRIQLMPLLLLMPYVYLQTRTPRILTAFLVIAGASVGWILTALHTTVDLRTVRAGSPSELALSYFTHPKDLLRMFSATFSDPDLTTFYNQSFIGVLGWLDTRFSAGIYTGLWAMLLTIGVLTVVPWRTRRIKGLGTLLIFIAVASAFMVFLLLLLTWTHVKEVTIQGVQGRYFIPAALAIAYALNAAPPESTGTPFVASTLYERLALIILALMALVIAYDLPQLLAERYYLS